MDVNNVDCEAEEVIKQEDVWPVISAYFEEQSFLQHQLESYNTFIEKDIQQIVSQLQKVEIRSEPQHHPGHQSDFTEITFKVKFYDVHLGEPMVTEADGESKKLLPMEARLRNLTYSAPLYVDIKKTIRKKGHYDEEVTKHMHQKTYIGKVPLMLHSSKCSLYNLPEKEVIEKGECPYDKGGYFIVNGRERVLIAQERFKPNNIFVFEKKLSTKHAYVAAVWSQLESQNRSPSMISVRMLCQPRDRGTLRTFGEASGHQIRATLPFIKTQIPIFLVFRAMGIVTDKDIVKLICYDSSDIEMVQLLKPSIEEASVIQNQQVALDYIGRRGAPAGATREKRIKYAEEILEMEMLPLIQTDVSFGMKKSDYLGYIVRQLLLFALGRRTANNDWNHYENRRLDIAGPLLGSLFRVLFKKLTKDLKAYAQKCIDNGKDVDLKFAIKSNTITRGLNYALGTGNWGPENSLSSRTGVTQVLDRVSYASSLSHLRRISSAMGHDVKSAKSRQVHCSHWGMICPTETPAGESCGVLKNLALMASITVGSDPHPILQFLSTRCFKVISTDVNISRAITVFVNGLWVGFHCNADMLVTELRRMRRQHDINTEVGIVRDIYLGELRIYTDYGRIRRPLFVVEKQRLIIKKKDIDALEKRESSEVGSWSDLVGKGFIEYLDVEEEGTRLISMHINDLYSEEYYTHCEIHPSLILGVCASIIPFPNHNQSPRNTFQSTIGKHSVGIYATNYLSRMDNLAYILHYPQKPLFGTHAMEHVNFRQLPAGTNAIVAIACYSGFNQGNSIIMNQSSIDRGFFRSHVFRTYRDKERSMGRLRTQSFGCPDLSSTMDLQEGSYAKLDHDGFVSPGTRVSKMDIIIGKTSPIEIEGHPSRYRSRDHSVSLRLYDTGVVDQVLLTTNADGMRFVKVRVRSLRIPQIGDKFSSLHGQKGTVGITYTQEDMPWTMAGITPDIIVNPHSFPSRMTLGQLMECITDKGAVHTGWEGDATPFTEVTLGTISKALHKCGYQMHGWETMYNGHTGRSLTAKVFIGPTYYQRLKHMIDDKIQYRARGPIEILTRQPAQGRSKRGGLRFGEMERDCLIAHGVANLLKERLFEQSDPYRVHVCEHCGFMAIANLRTRSFHCRSCKNRTDIIQVQLPYAFKLLVQELQAMGIAARMLAKGKPE